MNRPEVSVHPSAEVHDNAVIGAGTKIWQQAQVLDGAIVGCNCIIGHNCTVWGRSSLGNQVTLESNIDVWPMITIRDGAFLGPSVTLTNDRSPRAYAKKNGVFISTYIDIGASIGANATIICGVRIGHHAAIGAGALIHRDVPPFALMVGNPARRVGWVCLDNQWTKLDFNAGARATCSHCGLEYELGDEGVRLVSPYPDYFQPRVK